MVTTTITKQMYYNKIREMVEEVKTVIRPRIWKAYELQVQWLRSRGLEKPLNDMRYAFVDVYYYLENEGIHDKLLQLVKDCREKAMFFADESYKQEDCWNPTLDRSVTKVLGHTYTITEWLRQQAEFMAQDMKHIISFFEEAKNAPE